MTGPEPGDAGLPEADQPGNGGLGFSPAYLQNTGAPEYLLADGTPGSTPVPGSPRRRRKVWPFTSAIGIAAVVALLVALASAGLRSEHQDARTAAQVVATAARVAARVSSISASVTESLGSAGKVSATVRDQRSPTVMSASMTETFDGISVPLSMIVADDSLYMKIGSSAVPAGMLGKWIKVPLAGSGAGSEISSALSSIGSGNPASQAAMLAGASNVQAIGSQTIDGVPTTEYSGTLSLARAVKLVPASQRAFVGTALKQVSGNIDFTVWIDGSNQVKQLAETETVAGQSVHVVMTVLAYNQPVNVTIPSSSELYNLPAGSSPIS